MTLQEKISRANELTYALSNWKISSVDGLSAIRSEALRIKRLMQDIASTARTAQKRKCTHLIERHWNGWSMRLASGDWSLVEGATKHGYVFVVAQGKVA